MSELEEIKSRNLDISKRLVYLVSASPVLATMYVQLQRGIRKMAGDQKNLQRWLYAGGMCAFTTVITSIILCFGLTERCWGWLFPSLTPNDIENMDLAVGTFNTTSLIIFWILALYARLRSDIRRPEIKVPGSLNNKRVTLLTLVKNIHNTCVAITWLFSSWVIAMGLTAILLALNTSAKIVEYLPMLCVMICCIVFLVKIHASMKGEENYGSAIPDHILPLEAQP